MKDVERELREMMTRTVDGLHHIPRPSRGLIRRARLRRARTAVLAGAATLAVVIGGFAVSHSLSRNAQPIRPAESQTTERHSPSPGFSRFDSALHGISIDYPSDWQTRPATEAWNQDALAFGAPDVDVIFDPTLRDDLYFALVSEPLDGQAFDLWCCGPLMERSGICATATGSGGGSTTVAGNPAWVQSCGYGDADNRDAWDHVAFVATATRGYVIQLHVGNARLLETYDEDWFAAALETLDLRSE